MDDSTILCKTKEEFRNYNDSNRQMIVERHYRDMRTNQTVDFVRKMHKKYSFENGGRMKMSIRQAFKLLESYVDSSDPDLSLPNMIHMLQTAEGIRRDNHPEWFQLVGLIHDMGKIMFLWGNEEDGQIGKADASQWALGGDTWVVGCKIPDCVIFPEFNLLNKDYHHEIYRTELGMYEEKCGLDKLLFAYGHDEYLYQMLIANQCLIPIEGLAMIRFHSSYPWHQGGAYHQFMNDIDHKNLKWVLEFNKYDLYTKDQKGLDRPIEELWEYYQQIIDKYLPSDELMW